MKTKYGNIIASLRNNARESLTRISKKTHIPVSTIFDRLKEMEKGFIQKHTSLLDFNKLGFITRAQVLIKFSKLDRLQASEYLQKHMNVNTLQKITNGYDFMAEVVFKNLFELEEFIEKVEERFTIEEMKTVYIIQDIKREDFLSNIDLVNYSL